MSYDAGGQLRSLTFSILMALLLYSMVISTLARLIVRPRKKVLCLRSKESIDDGLRDVLKIELLRVVAPYL